VATGAGKTYAAYLGPLSRLIEESEERGGKVEGLRILYITPLRAMARDIELALQAPITELGLPLTVESRTGDTSQAQRARQAKRMPNVLVTTPESAALFLCREDASELASALTAVIVDEWHELLSTKRGTQLELVLSRLRTFAPGMRTWSLSATIANLDEAMQALIGTRESGVLVREDVPRPIEIETLLPPQIDAFPWAGHLGMVMLERLVEAIDINSSTLVFTNVRSQTERWYQAILLQKPEWFEVMALHHGSLDRDERERTEAGLKDGSIRLVVCTSSLDLGVDFGAVEQVFQIGSPRGIARLLQRAGRSGHRPGATSRVVCVPTHALELLEIAALRRGVEAEDMESRTALNAPFDVLAQHMVGCAIGGGFTPEGMWSELKSTWSYRNLTAEEFSWAIELLEQGGKTLSKYPEYRKLEQVNGRYVVSSKKLAQIHRMNIGTIVSDSSIDVHFANGQRLGSIEEIFIAGLRKGQKFMFAGRILEFVSHRGMKAIVKPSNARVTTVPRWGMSKLPITDVLSRQMRSLLNDMSQCEVGDSAPLWRTPELAAAAPVIDAQAEVSAWPRDGEVVAEVCRTREGWHLFVYPFEGRLVHEGIAALTALRLARMEPASFSYSVNDYGFELLSPQPFDYLAYLDNALFGADGLDADTAETVNLTELARYRFREVARVSMLTPQTVPGNRKSSRAMHTGAGMLFDIFEQFDPDNLLLKQAYREVLERNFERERLLMTLARLNTATLRIHSLPRPGPLAFPLIVERIGAKLSTQDLVGQVEAMKREFSTEEQAANLVVEEKTAMWGRLLSG
jgi:ATP-dependent Lhr-like helicase